MIISKIFLYLGSIIPDRAQDINNILSNPCMNKQSPGIFVKPILSRRLHCVVDPEGKAGSVLALPLASVGLPVFSLPTLILHSLLYKMGILISSLQSCED